MNSLSDAGMLQSAKSVPLVEGFTRAKRMHSRPSNRTFIRPLFTILPAAILQGGALSGTFHPNGVGRKDMIITVDTSLRGRRARRRLLRLLPAVLPTGCHRSRAARQSPLCRDALSWSPLRWPEHEPTPAEAPEPNLAQRTARRVSPSHLLVFPLVMAN